jgi:hypothetical protein
MRGTNLLEIHTPIDENAKILNVFFDLLRAQNSIV